MKTKFILLGLIFNYLMSLGQVQTIATLNNYSKLSALQMLDDGNLIYDAYDANKSGQVFSTNYLTGATKQLTNPCEGASNYIFFAPFRDSQPDGFFTDGNYYYGIINTHNNSCTIADKRVFKTDGNTLSYTNNTQVSLGTNEYGGLDNTLKSTDGNPLLIGKSEKIFKISKDNLSFNLLYSASASNANVDLYFVGSVNGIKMFFSRNNNNIYRFNDIENKMENLVNMKTFYDGVYPNSFFQPVGYANNSITNYIENVGVLNGYLYFWVVGNPTGIGRANVLWKTDGTVAGTSEVKRFLKNNQPVHQEAVSFTNFNNELYFRFNDEAGNAGLWKTNGSESGTVLVKKFSNTISSSFLNFMGNIVVYKSQLYFLADENKTNFFLWKSDGTTTGTSLAFKIIDTDFADDGNIYSRKLFVQGGKIYFYGMLRYSNEIICSDATVENTYSIGKNASANGSLIAPVLLSKNHIFFATTAEETKLAKLDLGNVKPYILQNVNYDNGKLTIAADDLSKTKRLFFYNINSDLLTGSNEDFTVIDNKTISYTLSQQQINYLKDKPFKVAVETETGTYLQKASENVSLAVNEDKGKSLNIYPNPVKDILHIQTNGENVKTINIYDVSGRQMLTSKAAEEINVSKLKKGAYVVAMETDREVKSFKIIKE